MPSILVTAPDDEPVSLQEAKQHCRVDISEDDALISGYIKSARQQAEQICRRAFMPQTWQIALDKFPMPGINIGSANWYGPQWGTTSGPLTVLMPNGKSGYEIVLPWAPLISINFIKYIDEQGVEQTLDPSQYKIDNFSEPARIVPVYGTTWPAARNEINAVRIEFTSGYEDIEMIPAPVKQWILLRTGAMYENRESDVIIQRGTVDSLPFVNQLLAPYRVLSF
jgi:uncharacterized phiE125 gp8 family phage protein